MGNRVVKLGELLDLLTDYHANGAYEKLKENVVLLDKRNYAAMIRTTNFEQNNFDTSLKYIDEHAYNFLKKSKVYAGDLIMNKIANAGSCYLMPDLEMPVSLAMNLFLLRVNKEKANPSYVYLYLKLNESYVKSFANGSVTKTITKDAVRNLEIILPVRNIQDAIADIYSTYTSKIQLNRQTNQTLEQMAQALFKSWFVDFDPVIDNALAAGKPIPEELQARAQRRQQQLAKPDHQPLPDDVRQLFPSEFEETEELGWVPKGWISKPFGELLDQTIGGDWGKEVPDDKHTVESVIVRGTDIPHLASGSQSSAPTRWVEPKKLKTRSLSDSDIVIEVSGGSPTQPTGRSIMMTENLLVRLGGTVEPASFCRKFRPINKEIGLVLGLHLQKIYADGKTWEYQNTSTGISNFQTKTFLSSELVLMPDNVELINKFYSLTRPYIDKMTSNDSIKLEKLRDTLLPKLISGELRLPESMLDSETNPSAETAYE